MLKLIKILIGLFCTLIFVLVIASMYLSFFHKEEIKNFVLKQVNKQLKSELRIDGAANISLFQYFPNMACSFKDVAIQDPLKPSEDLLKAESLSFLFSLSDWWNDQMSIENLAIKNGNFNIRYDESGRANWDIFKASAAAGTQGEIKASQLNKETQTTWKVFIEEAEMDMQFVGDNFDLELETLGNINEYVVGNTPYLTDKPLDLDLTMKGNMQTGKYVFEPSDLTLDENPLSFEGSMLMTETTTKADMDFVGKNLEINQLLGLLTNNDEATLQDWEFEGELDFEASLKGLLDQDNNFTDLLQTQWKIDLDKLIHKKMTMEDVKGVVCFQDQQLNLDNLVFETMGGDGKMDAIIETEKQSMKTHFVLNDIDLKQFVTEYDDFKDYIAPENLKGTLNLNLLLEGGVNKKYELDKDQMKGWADVEILDGALVNYDPLMSMMGEKDQKRMNAIKFKPIRNQVSIRNRILRIPRMKINSNLIAIDFSGKYSLQNSVNFHFKLDLLDYFNKRFFKKNKDTSEKNREGGLNYYCSLFGPPDAPIFKGKSKRIVEGEFAKDAQYEPVDVNAKATEKYNFGCTSN